MNAAARTLTQGNIFRGDFSLLYKGNIPTGTILLWVLVIASALSIIYVRHLERQYTHQIEQTVQENNQLAIQKGQLLLEKSMWSTPERIRHLAKHRLHMKMSKPAAVIMIQN